MSLRNSSLRESIDEIYNESSLSRAEKVAAILSLRLEHGIDDIVRALAHLVDIEKTARGESTSPDSRTLYGDFRVLVRQKLEALGIRVSGPGWDLVDAGLAQLFIVDQERRLRELALYPDPEDAALAQSLAAQFREQLGQKR